MKRTILSVNLWIAVGLLLANGAAWVYALAPAAAAVRVEPRLEPDLANLRAKLIEGGHSGEPFSLDITEQEAAESLAWYLARNPSVPFRDPQVSIRWDGIYAQGIAEIAGLSVGVSGLAHVALHDGRPVVKLGELQVAGVGVPGLVRDRIQAELDAQFGKAQNLPVVIEAIRLEEGRALVRGTIR
jgi:hypothetical protein